MGRKTIALKLSLLSPFIGEVVSSSTPPSELVNPITFLFLWGFYGSGVLLVRELWVRWRSASSLMALGVAYGIAEEGLAVKSFFDPGWMDLGRLAEYGRFAGVNFVWAVWLSIFHAVFSISIPILLIHIFHPEYRGPLLSPKTLKVLFGLFFALSVIISAFLNPYPPPLPQYILALLAVIYLVNRARKAVLKPTAIRNQSPPNQKNFLYGAFFTLSMFFFFFIIPETPVHPAVPCIAAVYLFFNLFRRLEGLSHDPEGSYRLILGLLTPFLLFFDLIAELNGNVGMSVVGILSFAVLLHLSKRLKSDNSIASQL